MEIKNNEKGNFMKPYVNFIVPPYHKRKGSGTVFPLGIGYLISSLSSHKIDSEILDFTEKMDDIEEEITELSIDREVKNFVASLLNKESPLFWGIGPITTASAVFLEWIISSIHKYSDQPIICGGPLPSISGQRWLFFDYLKVDAIIMGDGEKAIVEAAKYLLDGKLLSECPHIVTIGKPDYYNLLPDINDVPFPYRIQAKVSIRRRIVPSPTASMITMRGCPYQCPFCVSGNLRGMGRKKYSKRSIDNIITELKMLQSEGYRSVIFYDDCLFFGRNVNDQIAEFCYAICEAELCLNWTMELRPDVFELLTEESFSALAVSGCREINIGFESANFETQKNFKKKFDIQNTAMQCQIGMKAGIAINGTFIVGGPHETVETINNTISVASQLGLLFAHFTPLEVYPGTPLYTSMFKDDDRAWFYLLKNDSLKWNEIIYETKTLSSEKLISIASEAYIQFYSNPDWPDRIRQFFSSENAEQVIKESFEMIKNRYNI